MTRTRTERFVPPAIVLAFMAVAAGAAGAADRSPATAATAQDPAARAKLLEMANFIARAPGLSLTMRSGYDAVQADGQRIEFGERRRILMQRPDKLRVEVERSDGGRGGVTYDGRWITAFNANENVYARVEKVSNVDDILVYLVRDLRATVPLARMLRTEFPADVEKRATEVRLVEENTLFDVPTDHLAVRTPEVDLQLWIARGAQPLPRRVVITYRNDPGQPQFRADLYDWQIAPKFDAAAFSFVPPPGAEQISYLAPRPPADGTRAPAGESR